MNVYTQYMKHKLGLVGICEEYLCEEYQHIQHFCFWLVSPVEKFSRWHSPRLPKGGVAYNHDRRAGYLTYICFEDKSLL